MLINIRKMASSIFIRLLLGMIVFAFIGFGIKDVLHTTSNFDIVKFTDAENITENDFLKAKSEEISIIQKQNYINLSEDDIKELGIDQMVIRKLVNRSILNYLTRYYDLDITEKTVIELIKQSPVFANSNGEFDIGLFHSILRNSYQQEKEYLSRLKEDILKNTLLDVFSDSFKIPQSMTDSIISYIAEKREIDLVEMDLTKKPEDFNFSKFSTEQLKKFYDDNSELFTIPEIRNISYVLVSGDSIKKRIKISDDELISFYNENKEEFDEQNFNDAKKQIKSILMQQKLDELRIEFNKNLEDDVAGGSSLKEISEKYDLHLNNISNLKKIDILDDKTVIPRSVADGVFDMIIEEVSYPIELSNGSDFLLVEINDIIASKLEAFEIVAPRVEKLMQDQNLASLNMEKIIEISKKYSPANSNIHQLSSFGIKINKDVSITRDDINNNEKIPQELIANILQTKLGHNSSVFTKNNKAYFAHIKKIKVDDAKVHDIKKNTITIIQKNITNGIIAEMIQYFTQKNKMQVNDRYSSKMN